MVPTRKIQGVQVLPRNIEQLATDCFDEGQYQVALSFLSQVMGPTIVPSAEVLRQLLLLASCKPDRRAATLKLSHLRRKARRRKLKGPRDSASSASLPDDIPQQVVVQASALLKQYMPSFGFADAFLRALTPPSRESEEERSPRTRRSCSRDMEDDDEEEETCMSAGIQMLFHDSEGSVWEMLKILNAASRTVTRSGGPRPWHLPTPEEKEKKRVKRLDKFTNGAPASSSAWDTLQELTHAGWSLNEWESDQIDQWYDRLELLQNYQSERCWKLADLFVSAWQTQGRSLEEETPFAEGPNGAAEWRTQLGRLHLVQQLQSRASSLPLDDIGEALDLVFAALCNLEAWTAEQPSRLRTSPERRIRRAEIAGRLFSELARLSRLGAVDPSALIRGVKQRLFLASTSAWTAFAGVVRHDATASAIIAEACKLDTSSETLRVDRRGINYSAEASIATPKELAFELLREDLVSSLVAPASLQTNRAFAHANDVLLAIRRLQFSQTQPVSTERTGGGLSLPKATMIGIAILEESVKMLESDIHKSWQLAGVDLSSSSSHQVAPQSAGSDSNVARSNSSRDRYSDALSTKSVTVPLGTVSESGTPSEIPLRKSGRQVKPPARTGLRNLPTHGMSRGKPPFRKEKGEMTPSVSPSRSASPSKGAAGAGAGAGAGAAEPHDRRRDDAGSTHEVLDLTAWLYVQTEKGLASLHGRLSALRAAERSAAASASVSGADSGAD